MTKALVSSLVAALGMTVMTGCSWSVGSGPKSANMMPTTGQQLIDLQRAKDAGAISESEYQSQKAKILGRK